MEQGMEMLFALFGGLAMFLYGMDRMSRALQRAAGDAMKRLMARLTATPLLGVLTGLAVTAVLQSSSAATVMVIGFVSAGLLELPRAVAVIYGINIGTTMTAQLIAFDVQTLVYPVLFLGFLLDFAARRPRWQAVGEAVFSFGLLFEGIDILGRALQPLAGQAVFLDWMTRVKESPLLGILLGLSMTMVVQSSSATIALLQNVARQAGPDGIYDSYTHVHGVRFCLDIHSQRSQHHVLQLPEYSPVFRLPSDTSVYSVADAAQLHPESGTSPHDSLQLQVRRLHSRPDPVLKSPVHGAHGYPHTRRPD